MKYCNGKGWDIHNVQGGFHIDDDDITTPPARREESDILHHCQATVTVADMELVSSSRHHSKTQNFTTTNSNSDKTIATTRISKKNDIDGHNNHSLRHVVDDMALEALLMGNLTDEQGLILKHLLSAQEKEYQYRLQGKDHQHQLQAKEYQYQLQEKDRQCQLQESEHQRQLQEKEHQHQLELVIKEKDYELLMERKVHEVTLMLEKKDAKIAKQQLELELLKVQLSSENNSATGTDDISNRTMTFDRKLENTQEQIEQVVVSTTKALQNRIEQMEIKIDDNNNVMSENFIKIATTTNENIRDSTVAFDKKMEEIQERLEGMNVSTMRALQNCVEQTGKKLDEYNNAMNDNLINSIKLIMEKNDTKLNQVMNLIQPLFVPKPVTFKNDGNSWKTFVPSSWPPMKFGKHKWTFKYSRLKPGDDLYGYVGLITVSDHLQHKQEYQTTSLNNIPSWFYNIDELIYHNGNPQRIRLPTFSRVDSISFVLDLGTNDHQDKTTEAGIDTTNNNGSWYVRVHGNEEQLLFSDLSSIAKSKGGFFPAVSLYGNHQVTFEYYYENVLEE